MEGSLKTLGSSCGQKREALVVDRMSSEVWRRGNLSSLQKERIISRLLHLRDRILLGLKEFSRNPTVFGKEERSGRIVEVVSSAVCTERRSLFP
jgi:hypothetical protein